MENKLLADTAHENYTYIVQLRNGIKKYFWILIKELKTCRENKYWQVLGYESWPSYLAMPEIDLSPKTVDNYITVLNRLTESDVLPPEGVDVSKVAIIAPHLTKENALDIIAKAETLSRSDLIAEVIHKELPIQKLSTCPKCGFEF